MKQLLLIILTSILCLTLSGCTTSLLVVKAATTDIPLGANVDDSSLYIKIRRIIYTQFHLQATAHVEVTVFNRVAVLAGVVLTQRDKRNLNQTLAQLTDLNRFYDFTQVNPNPPKVSYLKDAMITSKVKMGLFWEVNPMNFKILTYNRVVFLLGRCSQARCKQALTIARRTKNVNKVVDILTVISTIKKEAPIKHIQFNSVSQSQNTTTK